jgi:hypothetical protein
MKKLTDRQAELLEAMRSGTRVYYMPYAGRFNPRPYYWRADTYRRCTQEAKALLNRGLVVKCNETWRGHQLKAVTTTEPT